MSPPCDNSGKLSVSMVLAHTFTGYVHFDMIKFMKQPQHFIKKSFVKDTFCGALEFDSMTELLL